MIRKPAALLCGLRIPFVCSPEERAKVIRFLMLSSSGENHNANHDSKTESKSLILVQRMLLH
jgi:hypothetical protein